MMSTQQISFRRTSQTGPSPSSDSRLITTSAFKLCTCIMNLFPADLADLRRSAPAGTGSPAQAICVNLRDLREIFFSGKDLQWESLDTLLPEFPTKKSISAPKWAC